MLFVVVGPEDDVAGFAGVGVGPAGGAGFAAVVVGPTVVDVGSVVVVVGPSAVVNSSAFVVACFAVGGGPAVIAL